MKYEYIDCLQLLLPQQLYRLIQAQCLRQIFSGSGAFGERRDRRRPRPNDNVARMRSPLCERPGVNPVANGFPPVSQKEMDSPAHLDGLARTLIARLQKTMAIQGIQESARTHKQPAVRCRIKFIRQSLLASGRIQITQGSTVLLDCRHARRDVEMALDVIDKQTAAPLV